MNYKIVFSKVVEKELSKIPKAELKKIQKKIEEMATDPFCHDCKKLRGEDDIYRVRQVDYRILYTVYKNKLIVLILNVGNRKEIYK